MSQHAFKLDQIRAIINEKPEQARALCQRIVQSAPRDAWAQATMSRVLLRMGQLEQALHYAMRAAELAPGEPRLLIEAGELLCMNNKNAQAVGVLERALELSPRDVTAACQLGLALVNLNRPSQAEGVLRRALELSPGSVNIQSQLAGALFNMGRIEETIEYTRAACARYPENQILAGGLALMLNYVPGVTPQEVFAAHAQYGELLEKATPAPSRVYVNTREPERRLRVGLVSPDLRQHSVAYFIEPWLEKFDRESFEVVVYQTNKVADAVTARLKAATTRGGRWRVMDNISDEGLAAAIFADRVDVLVDLSGHTHAHSLACFQLRPAPVQATYLGYPNTTGVRAIGYRIVDSVTDPEGALAVEKLVRIDPCFLCYRPGTPAHQHTSTPAHEHTSTPAHQSSTTTDAGAAITFGSFNTVQKLNRSVIACWGRVLQAVPGSRLLLKGGAAEDSGMREAVVSRFVAGGVDAGRVEFLPRTEGVAEHLALYSRVDIALDPFPYNGTTTTCEALWMGVPVVTLAGQVHAGRVGASLLGCVGLPELVSRDEDGYVAVAARLAEDHSRRAELRKSLRGTVAGSALCDEAGFAARFAGAVRGMWREWCGSGG